MLRQFGGLDFSRRSVHRASAMFFERALSLVILRPQGFLCTPDVRKHHSKSQRTRVKVCFQASPPSSTKGPQSAFSPAYAVRSTPGPDLGLTFGRTQRTLPRPGRECQWSRLKQGSLDFCSGVVAAVGFRPPAPGGGNIRPRTYNPWSLRGGTRLLDLLVATR